MSWLIFIVFIIWIWNLDKNKLMNLSTYMHSINGLYQFSIIMKY